MAKMASLHAEGWTDNMLQMSALDFGGYMEDIVIQERIRILREIDNLEKQSHDTRTPLYQETMFKKIREIVGQTTFPPKRFRDIANGE